MLISSIAFSITEMLRPQTPRVPVKNTCSRM